MCGEYNDTDYNTCIHKATLEVVIVESVLSISNLSVRIKNQNILQDISFEIGEGEVVLLSGENGVGKSTILKSVLRLENEGKIISGEIRVRGYGSILTLGTTDLQRYRSRIAYVQQRDDYAEMGNIQVKDIISESGQPNSGKVLSTTEVNDLIDRWIPRKHGNKRIFNAKSKPAKFSGGEQRLLSVLSVVATRPEAELLIIDEPLNNLDFINARNISNIINKVIRDNPNMAVLMISHCRIFPFITREIVLTSEGIQEARDPYICHSCFGEPNGEGFYI